MDSRAVGEKGLSGSLPQGYYTPNLTTASRNRMLPLFQSASSSDLSQVEPTVSYVEQDLSAGEQIVYKTGLHWIVLFWPAFFGAFFAVPGLILLMGSLFDKDSGGAAIAALIWLVVAGLLVLFGYLSWKATGIAVTNKRIVIDRPA